MAANEIVAIVPVRFLPSLKHRLAKHLDVNQRKQLVQYMLLDILEAINHSKMITRCLIVTNDESFQEVYLQSGIEVHRSGTLGLNEELTECLDSLSQTGSGYAVVILGDLPLLTGTVLDGLIWSGLQSNRPVIARDWKNVGTNALFFPYPLTFKLQFGIESFQKHMTELRSNGFNPIVYHSIETALDLDDNEAVAQLLVLAAHEGKGQDTRTFQFLREAFERKGR
ncbi:MAG: 2-phospho-L-lactate guanylyltransferase [Candidatus Thorarchaeota archaeon]